MVGDPGVSRILPATFKRDAEHAWSRHLRAGLDINLYKMIMNYLFGDMN